MSRAVANTLLPAARPASTIARPRPRELPVTNHICAIHPPLSTLLDQRGSALADFLKLNFESTKFLRAQFREYLLHLPGMLAKGGNDEILAAWREGNDPNASVF